MDQRRAGAEAVTCAQRDPVEERVGDGTVRLVEREVHRESARQGVSGPGAACQQREYPLPGVERQDNPRRAVVCAVGEQIHNMVQIDQDTGDQYRQRVAPAVRTSDDQACQRQRESGVIPRPRHVGQLKSCWLAMLAPSTRDRSLAHMIDGGTRLSP